MCSFFPPSTGATFLNGVDEMGRGNERPHSAKARKCRLQADSEGQVTADWPCVRREDGGGTTAGSAKGVLGANLPTGSRSPQETP
jgi:hypothetical protein